MRSAMHVIDEIVFLRKQGKTRVNFSDDTITANVKRLTLICDLLEALKLNIEWICESRVDVMTGEMLERMRKLGCIFIQFGVESGSQKVLDLIRKKITLEQVQEVVKQAHECGYKEIICSFIVGHPFDTEDTVYQSIQFAVKLQRAYGAEVRFHVCTPYPGTTLFQKAKELGVQLISQNYEDYNFFNPVMDTQYLTHQQIRNLYFIANQTILANLPENVATSYAPHGNKIGPKKGKMK